MDPDVVRGSGDRLQSDGLMLVAPSEAVLRIDEFGGRPQGSSPWVREGAAGTVVERRGGGRDRVVERGLGVGEESDRGRGVDHVPRKAAWVHPRLPATAACRVMDREHAGGEVERL